MWWEISTNNMQFESLDFPTFVYKNNKNAYAAIVIKNSQSAIKLSKKVPTFKPF